MLEYNHTNRGTNSNNSDAELDAEVAKGQRQFLGEIVKYMDICCLVAF